MSSIRGQYMGGGSVLFEEFATVGDIMLRVARDEHRFASDVVVLPVGSGEVLTHDRTPPPDVSIVLKKKGGNLSAEECEINVALYAETEDTATVVRALAMLRDVSPATQWPEKMLEEAARDPAKGKTVRTLVRAGVDGGDALVNVSADGDAVAVQRLLRAGTNVNPDDEYDLSALLQASIEGHKEVVQILVDARADVNHDDEDGLSALWWASNNGHKEVVQILIDARADFCPGVFMRASYQGHKEVVQILVDARADVNHVDVAGWSALFVASSEGHRGVVQILIEARADINHLDGHGQSALWWASSEGHRGVVQILIEARAEVNRVDADGRSALTEASISGHKEVAQILIDAGAVHS